MQKKKWLWVAAGVLLVFIIGCGAVLIAGQVLFGWVRTTEVNNLEHVDLTTDVQGKGDGWTKINLCLVNQGEHDIDLHGDQPSGTWQLVNQDDDIRTAGEGFAPSWIKAGEINCPFQWKGHLEVGTYTLTWTVDRYGSVTERFRVTEDGVVILP